MIVQHGALAEVASKRKDLFAMKGSRAAFLFQYLTLRDTLKRELNPCMSHNRIISGATQRSLGGVLQKLNDLEPSASQDKIEQDRTGWLCTFL